MTTTFAINAGYYFALALWLMLGLTLLISLTTGRWAQAKRISKYLINSVVLLVAFGFYLELALIVRPPVESSQLAHWVRQHVIEDLDASAIVVILLLGVNVLFYYLVEQKRHKYDVVGLFMFDAFILVIGSWLSGLDAYYGLLAEANRSLH